MNTDNIKSEKKELDVNDLINSPLDLLNNPSISVNEKVLIKLLISFGEGVDNVIGLFHPKAIIEYPYAPLLGTPQRLKISEYKEYIGNALKIMPDIKFENVKIYQTTDPALIIMECHGSATVPGSGIIYNQDYFMIVRFKDTKIIEYKEYWNPLELKAFGGHSNAKDLFKQQ